MSSFLSRSSTVKDSRTKKRSESASALYRTKEERRIPVVSIEDDRDVATLVSIEISRAIMLNPELDLGIFLKTAANSRRDISISDATIIISVAVLDHIGNKRMANNLLMKSSTLTKYYDKMGLNDIAVREMLVTLLFALSPQFVKMIETSIRLAVDRSAAIGRAPHAENQIANALVTLAESGTISDKELISASTMDTDLIPEDESLQRRLSIQKTPTDMIAPSESASIPAILPKNRRRPTEENVRVYNSRRRSGPEPAFTAVFPRASKPVHIEPKNNRYGIGYKPGKDSSNWFAAAANHVLGSSSVLSYNIRTGDAFSRRPTVEDFLDSEPVPNSVLESPPDVRSDLFHNYALVKNIKPEPTETVLPRSTYEGGSSTVKALSEKDSLEELRGRFRATKL